MKEYRLAAGNHLTEKIKKIYQKSPAIICQAVSPLCLHRETPPPAACGPYLSLFIKKAQRSLTQANIWEHICAVTSNVCCCCCLNAISHTHHSRAFIWLCSVQPQYWTYCRRTSETVIKTSSVHQLCSLDQRS